MRPEPLRPDAGGRYLDALFERSFTPEQRAAVVADLEPRLVIAGAGSGKTTVMAARVVHAVAVHGVAASAVLGLTFTTKAAGELRTRVRRALAELGGARSRDEFALFDLSAVGGGAVGAGTGVGGTVGGDDPDAAAAVLDDQPTVSTYSAYAASLVRDHALRVGREPEARQLSDADSWQLALGVVRRARGPFQRMRWKPENVAALVLTLDSELAEHEVAPAALRVEDARIRRWVAGAPKPLKDVVRIATASEERDELLVLVEAYRERKRELDLLDFSDQIAVAAQIATTCPEVGAGERERYGLVLLDEYQDTSVGQRVLLQALFVHHGAGHALTAVGDPCQAIYGWRGASVGNLLRFPEHFPRGHSPRGAGEPPYAPDYLLTSFRNGGRILAVANRLSRAVREPAAGSPGRHVPVPVLHARPGAEDDGEVRAAWHADVEHEAVGVADGLVRAHDDGAAWSAMAVLCRTRTQFPALHRALVAADVPVEVVGLGGLLEMPEVADVVAVLDVVADPLANPSLLRVLTGARYRIGPRDLAALGRRAAALARRGGLHVDAEESSDDPDGSRVLQQATAAVDPVEVVALSDALASPGDPGGYSPQARERFARLRAELAGLRPVLIQPVAEAVAAVVAAIGLDTELLADPDGLGAGRAANLAAFTDAAVRFESVEGHADVPSFLEYLGAVREREEGWDPAVLSTSDTVKLMTVHKAKGLEWDVVAVPGLVTDAFPSNRGRPLWTTRAETLPYVVRGDREDLPGEPVLTTAGLTGLKAEARALDLLEERRLVYVAVTRARSLVLASGACWNAPVTKARAPSDFLLEVRAACEAGAGPVGPWCAEPPETNPFLARAGDVAYPPADDPGARARRRAAAGLVEGAMTAETAAGLDRPSTTAAGWLREADLLVAELAAQRAGEHVVPLPKTLSASQVVRLAEDPERFAADLARPLPRRPSALARRGTAFHSWVEEHFGVRPLLEDVELLGARDPEHPDDPALAELRAAFARSPYAERTPVGLEVPFQLSLGGRLLRGRIDAVFAEPPGLGGEPRYEVVDWKTGSTLADPLQLAVYRLAWARLRDVPVADVSAAFLYVTSGRVQRYPDLPGEDEVAALLGTPDGRPAQRA